MNGAVAVHTGQLSRMGLPRQILKEGSSVLVRIISDKGNGKYEGSVAGARVTINSRMSLTPGSTFTAVITSKNGQILLSPQIKNEQNSVMQNFQLSVLNDEHLAAFIKNLNLPPDDVTFHLLQQMKQLEMKLDPRLLGKLHNLALKFKGRELRASELLMIFSKKELDFSEEEILSLLNLLDRQNEQEGSESSAYQNQKQKKNYHALNKINSKKISWQFLPYQINCMEQTLAQGFIKVLLDSAGHLKLLNLDCNWDASKTKYLFSLEFEGGVCRTIKMNAGDSDDKTRRLANLLQKKLWEKGLSIKVESEISELLEGTACSAEDFYIFGGEI